MLELYDLKTEYLKHPNAVDSPSPRFSWKIRSDRREVMQESYRIYVWQPTEREAKARREDAKKDAEKEKKGLLWDSGTVSSGESRFIRYAGKELFSRQKVCWQAEVTCIDGEGRKEKAVSEPAEFQMGLLKESDWIARWIGAGEEEGRQNRPEKEEGKGDRLQERRPALYLRKPFTVKKGLREARIYQSAHGLYETWMNGKECTQDLFLPGLTSYYARIQYQTYDITEFLREGENVWATVLADGWWRGVTGGSVVNNFGYQLHYLGQLELFYEDGTFERIGTDESFLYAAGGLLASDMMMGDIYDAAKEPEGWKKKEFCPEVPWKNVCLVKEHTDARLIASRSVPVRRKEAFFPMEFLDAGGRRVLDFGQNMAGQVRMALKNCKKGQRIRLVHGEALDPDGNFSVENISDTSYPAQNFQEILYLCKGEKEEIYCPSFCVFGFRYVLVEGYEEEIQPGDFIAYAVYSDLEETGDFFCSHEGINRLVENSRWSQKGNFLDVAVDCPTRERNAWTGDAQVYVRTAADFMNVYPFFEKWLYDQKLEQYESGKVGITFPSTSSVHNPDALAAMKENNPMYELAGPSGDGNIGEDSCGWGDSAVWLPYAMYLCYGDPAILEQQYETARRWVEFELAQAKKKNPLYASAPWYQGTDGDYVWDTCFHYGEWNEAKSPEEIRKEAEERQKADERKKTGSAASKEHPKADSVCSGGAEEKEKKRQQKAAYVKNFVEQLARLGNPKAATAYLRRSARNLAEMAEVLGKTEDFEKYSRISEKTAEVYDRYFIGEDGTIDPGHQAAYVRALAMELCCEEKKAAVAKKLAEEIQKNEMCLNTGFLSTPFLLPVLAEYGYQKLAYALLEQEKSPGWLHPVNLGATTIPESWSSLDLFQASFNHYSYGAVCEFLFACAGGIRPIWEAAGYREFEIRPLVGGSLQHAGAVYESPFGRIVSRWEILPQLLTGGRKPEAENKERTVRYHLEIPPNTMARVSLPGGTEMKLGSGVYQFTEMVRG